MATTSASGSSSLRMKRIIRVWGLGSGVWGNLAKALFYALRGTLHPSTPFDLFLTPNPKPQTPNPIFTVRA